MGTPRRRTVISNLKMSRTNETMRLILTTFVGIIIGFFLGVSFPSLSFTKACGFDSYFYRFVTIVFRFSKMLLKKCFASYNFDDQHAHLPSRIFPSINIAYIEDKYSDLPTQALLNLWSSLKGHKGISHGFNNTKIWAATNPRGAE
ncbi:uncharacterized protein [Primulina eburnea]|uniref:uncharacterized protein n=1 Tax=Primulina eburnea TaxID=1245227 RepID=UPI003C6BF7A9